MLILWYSEYTTVGNIWENETAFKIEAWGLQGLCDNGIFYNNSQWEFPARMCQKNKVQLDAYN